ncbi:MAG: VOC family protein [Rhodospirillales bacterium]|jgi:catechol 2,3-dioxygenase-like lactoylglutathione lyase family enzyme|nr:VOC family protein [Rhodospirillales bacterium]MBT4006212.1 VOC family protein [Rhodospirillales bacterium]MBT5075790.1 VOC family protein [Rhodospirillales bacterium]MBT5114393.1 VOC family protein [Rhodospirillales bacterium]MBT5672785.1 VOC family protein [Rhodospirillales bacterium]
MAKIRHLAIVTTDPDKLAKFYVDVFGLEIQQRADSGNIFMTDGYLNIALLTNKAEGKPSGLNHFGFHIDDMADITAKLETAGVPAPAKRPADRHYAEMRAFDPDGNNFDLSVNGFERVRKDREPVAD